MRSTELFEKKAALRKFRKLSKKAMYSKMDFYRYALNNGKVYNDREVVL
jgi:hypothetical protein